MVAMGNIYLYLKYGKIASLTTEIFIFPILLLLLVVVVQFQTCISKPINSSNLKLYTQVGLHDGLCSHMLNFLYIV